METIILFGRGRYFEEKKNAIFDAYNVKEIWDSGMEPGKSEWYRDIPVLNPKDVQKNGQEKIFLLSVRFIGMWKALVESDIDPDRIMLPHNLANWYENDEVISKCVKKITFKKDEIIFKTFKGEEYRVCDEDEWRDLLRKFYRDTFPVIDAISTMNTVPVSLQFGTERGTPIDRYYIEEFLNRNRQKIQGTVLEIEDNNYTREFGVEGYKSVVMDVSTVSSDVDFQANLETGEGIKDGIADCFILTQTLMYLYNTDNAADNIHRLLKTNGVALITCSGISQNSRRCMDEYGCMFNYNVDAFKKMFSDSERFEILELGSYGNVKTVCAHLAGLCQEDLTEHDFDINDRYYPLVVYVAVRRVD